jgi:hypothetical protein
MLVLACIAVALYGLAFLIYSFIAEVFPAGLPSRVPNLMERRLKPFRAARGAAASRNVITALSTARIMVLRRINGVFTVLGESGTVYEVTIALQPACTCPSFEKRFLNGAQSAVCKHLAFIYVKVLGVPAHSYVLHQTALTSYEVDYWLARARATNLAPKPVLEALGFAEATKRNDTTCSICYDEIEAGASTLRCTGQCRNLFHAGCVSAYNNSQLPAQALCAVCRAPWLESELQVQTVVDSTGTARQVVTHPHGKFKRRSRSKKP